MCSFCVSGLGDTICYRSRSIADYDAKILTTIDTAATIGRRRLLQCLATRGPEGRQESSIGSPCHSVQESIFPTAFR